MNPQLRASGRSAKQTKTVPMPAKRQATRSASTAAQRTFGELVVLASAKNSRFVALQEDSTKDEDRLLRRVVLQRQFWHDLQHTFSTSTNKTALVKFPATEDLTPVSLLPAAPKHEPTPQGQSQPQLPECELGTESGEDEVCAEGSTRSAEICDEATAVTTPAAKPEPVMAHVPCKKLAQAPAPSHVASHIVAPL